MQILYRQSDTPSILSKHEIVDCCLKRLTFNTDAQKCTKKRHHHNEFEIHIMISGHQNYEINETYVCVNARNLLIIPPGTYHRAVEFDKNTEKYAITFKLSPQAHIFDLPKEQSFYTAAVSPSILDGLSFIANEAKIHKTFSPILIENRLFEIIISFFREMGMRENQADISETLTSPIISMAKQFIADNIEVSPSVYDVALYCHISYKQLSRIFMRYENISAFDYIREQRITYAQKLLRETQLSIKEISETMNFSSEYYFNSFFKANCGVPPGVYRKMT